MDRAPGGIGRAPGGHQGTPAPAGHARVCAGALWLHVDGTVAACSEEVAGRPCAGVGALHLGGTCSCADALGPGACELCAPDAFSERDWRHVAHVARFARTHRRCRAQRATYRRATGPVPPG